LQQAIHTSLSSPVEVIDSNHPIDVPNTPVTDRLGAQKMRFYVNQTMSN
jgi:hypothetical protein